MCHIEVSKGHSKWRAHANSVDLGVEGPVRELEGASDGAGLQQLAQDVFRDGQWGAVLISVNAVTYYVDGFTYWDIGEE